ncbi:MAG: hypothetical protein NC489_20705 [Ruminococcus flavefaciens]|nr:hypothetical protein [Ruminococcus flavefaciens]
MLLFSTILDIDDSLTKEDFIKLVLEWNQGSPHENNIIKGIEWHGERNVRYGSNNLWLAIEEYSNQNIIAVRYEKQEEDGVIWDTDYVMNFNAMKMAIRLDRSYLEEALAIDPKFSTPHFITLLIDRGYLKDDGKLPVLRAPIIMNDENIELVADIIKGNVNYRLPVVFISKTFYDEDPVNVQILARRLKGVAHVIVQQSNCSNGRLRNLCDGKNEYYGAIGIYYASQAIGHKRYLYRSSIGMDNFLLEKVIRVVIQYNNSQMIEPLYTWQGVNNALLRDQLSSQKEERAQIEEERRMALYELLALKENLDKTQESMQQKAIENAKAEADRILDSFDEDLKRLQKQIEDLTRTNDALTYENQGLRAKMDNVDLIPILYLGDEDDFYQGEIKEMILDTIDEKLKNLSDKTRRFDVLSDVLKNNDYKKIYEQREKTIKNMFRDYKNMSSVMRQQLQALGLEITEEGKHYRLTYFGDERYKTTIAKTGSDWREGKNIAAAILKSMM